MISLRYHLVDVFTDTPFGGNPLAVFPDGRGIPVEAMQAIAKELNLSETTFVLPCDDASADARVRIFTPAAELAFAGHPTLGTAYVLSRLGKLKQGGGVLQLGIGPVAVALHAEAGGAAYIEMEQRPPTFGAVGNHAAAATLLSVPESALLPEVPVQAVSCGSWFTIVPVRDLEAMRALRPRQDLWSGDPLGVGASAVLAFTCAAETPRATVHARMFAPWLGVVEDPATGSAAGPLACYLVQHGLVPSAADGVTQIVVEQGIELGRPSLLHTSLERRGGEIHRVAVGGHCVPVGQGELEAAIVTQLSPGTVNVT